MAYLWNKKLDAEAKRKDRMADRKKRKLSKKAAKLPKSVRKSGTVVHDKPASKRRRAKYGKKK